MVLCWYQFMPIIQAAIIGSTDDRSFLLAVARIPFLRILASYRRTMLTPCLLMGAPGVLVVKTTAGSALIAMGYENNDDW